MNLKKPNKSCIVLGLIIILLSSFVISAYTAPVIYFADGYPGIGAVYRLENGKEEAYYTRSRQRLHSFAFTKNNVLYFSDANDFNVNKVENEEEVLVYSHTTYLRHIEFDSMDQLYFSQSSGGGADGYIYRLVNGKPSLYYRVRISDVGYWSGDFTFDSQDNLYLTNGNMYQANIYKVERGIPKIIYTGDDEEGITGICFDSYDNLFYSGHNDKIYKLDDFTGRKQIIYDSNHTNITDISVSDLPLHLSLHIEDAPEGIPVNKLTGDTNGPTYYTRLEITAKLYSKINVSNVPVTLSIPGNALGSPINTWIRNSDGGNKTSTTSTSLGGGNYRVSTNLSAYYNFFGRPIYYRKQIVWRFLIPNNMIPQNLTVTAEIELPCDDPKSEGIIKILKRGSVSSLIITNRKLLYANHTDSQVTDLLQQVFIEAQGWPANRNPCSVVYYVERYHAKAFNWDYTAVDYSTNAKANEAADAIDDLIEDWYDDATEYLTISIPFGGKISIPQSYPRYLLIVGDDDTIPFYRYDDPSNDEGILLHNCDGIPGAEHPGWCTDSNTNPAIRATDEDCFFTDNPYADVYGGGDWDTGDIELWNGRILGDSAADMLSLLEEGVDRTNGNTGGIVMASVDGWELGLEPDDGRPGEIADLCDVPALFRGKGFLVRNDDVPNTEVRTIDVMSPFEANWNLNFRNAANDAGGMDLFFIGGHNHYDHAGIPGDNFSCDDTPTLYTRFDDDNPVVMIVGCHGGLPVPDIDVPGGVDNCMSYDMAHEGARAFIGASGFSYGSPGNLHSNTWAERMMQMFFMNLLAPGGGNSMAIGKALAEAKRDFTFGFGTNDGLDRKTVTEFNLYGVPWSFLYYPTSFRSEVHGAEVREPNLFENNSDLADYTVTPGSIIATSEPGIYKMNFVVEVYKYQVNRILDNGVPYDVFSIGGGDTAIAQDTPVLPFIEVFDLPLPHGAEVKQASILEISSSSLGKYDIPIAQVKAFINGGVTYTMESNINYAYPAKDDLIQIQKSKNGALITLFPIQFNPATDEVLFNRLFQVEVTYEAPIAFTISDFVTDKKIYFSGEDINTKVLVSNVDKAEVPVDTIIYIVNEDDEIVQKVQADTVVVPSASSVSIPVRFSGTLNHGAYTLRVEISSGGINLGGIAEQITVIGAEITDLEGPANGVIGETVTFRLTFGNYSANTFTGEVHLSIKHKMSGFNIIFPTEPVTVDPDSKVTVPFSWNTGKAPEGEYTVLGSVTDPANKYGPVSASIVLSEYGLLGDSNSDGMVDIVDALLTAQFYVGIIGPGDINEKAIDVDCNEIVDIVDALLIAQYYVGIITSFPCTVEPEPNLQPENFTSPASSTPGGTVGVDLNLDVRNSGATNAISPDGYFFIGFYLSANSTWDSSDTLLLGGRESLATPMTPNQISPVSIYSGMSIPTGTVPGAYYLLAVVDEMNQVAETNENDNVAANRIYITGSNPNLVPANFASPSSSTPGGVVGVDLSLDVSNIETGVASNTEGYIFIGFYLSTNSTWDGSDVLLLGGRESVNTPINPSETKPVSIFSGMSIPAATTPGSYYLLAVVDEMDTVSESNEGDNIAARAIRINSTGSIIIFDAGGKSGALGGRAGADALCSTYASSHTALAGKKVRAFISVSSTDEIRDMPSNYGVPTNLPIVSLTGKKIADNWADLLDGTIDMTLYTADILQTQFWYSGSNANGSLNVCNCTNWTSPDGYLDGRYGRYIFTDANWISLGNATCGSIGYKILGLAWD